MRTNKKSFTDLINKAGVDTIGAYVIVVVVAVSGGAWLAGYASAAQRSATATTDGQTSSSADTLSSSNSSASKLSTTDSRQTVTVQVVADSGSQKVNAVQARVTYPADKLTYRGVKEGSAFPVVLATDASKAGVVLVARGSELRSGGMAGKHDVVNLVFTAKSDDADASAVNVDATNSLLVAAGSSHNVLGSSGTSLSIVR
jgi:hypothetical protein